MKFDYANRRIKIRETKIQKDAAAITALQKLRSFLDASEPQLVRFLVTLWNNQGRAITYKELREAILSGELSPEYLEEWMQDYSRFVTVNLQPAWEKAMQAAAAEIAAKYPVWNFDPMHEGVQTWTRDRAAIFVTNSTQAQIEGLRAVIRKAAVLEDMNVDELARVIRPMVGLTYQQGIANMNYYETLIQSGMKPEKAKDLSIRYSARQHRYRGYNIARTELAFAYNQGGLEGTKQAQEAGYMGEVVKIWCTADDERVCRICGSLEGKRIAMDEDFYYEFTDANGNKVTRRINPKLTNEAVGKVPPAHPSCRCTVMYKEIKPPR